MAAGDFLEVRHNSSQFIQVSLELLFFFLWFSAIGITYHSFEIKIRGIYVVFSLDLLICNFLVIKNEAGCNFSL